MEVAIHLEPERLLKAVRLAREASERRLTERRRKLKLEWIEWAHFNPWAARWFFGCPTNGSEVDMEKWLRKEQPRTWADASWPFGYERSLLNELETAATCSRLPVPLCHRKLRQVADFLEKEDELD